LCPFDGDHQIHYHGSYTRYAKADSDEVIQIPRWLCTVCIGTISVLPDDRLPYRAVNTTLVMAFFDAVLAGLSPPCSSEKERGCLARALRAFSQNILELKQALGQIISVITTSAAQLWTLLRRGRNLDSILQYLSKDFKTSLTYPYLCLRCWPAPG